MKKLLFLFLCLISFSSAYAVEYYSVGGDAKTAFYGKFQTYYAI